MIEANELVIGIVRGPIGVEGDLALSSCSGETAHFRGMEGFDALLPGGERIRLRIERMEEDPKGLLVRFAGYDSPERAAKLTGAEIVAPRDQAAPLREGQYYATDLIGCSLVFSGSPVAKVLSLIEGGGYDFLEAELPGGRRACVPFLREFIGEVDLGARSIELRKDWILE